MLIQGCATNNVLNFIYGAKVTVKVKETLASILETQRLDRGFKQGEIAESLELSQGTISNMEKKPEKHLLTKHPNFVLQFLELYQFSEGRIKQLAVEFGIELPFSFMSKNQYAQATDADKALYVGRINGGLRSALKENESEKRYVSVPGWIKDKCNLADVFVATVAGDSMACAEVRDELPEGTEVYFCRSLQPESGNIVAVWLQGEDIGVLKKFKPGRNYTTLESYNGTHKPITVDEANPGIIQGVLIGYSRPFRK